MGFKTDEANLRADANQTGEIDLYDELIAFSNLSPKNQGRGQATSISDDPAGPVMQTSFELVNRPELQRAEGMSAGLYASPVDDFSSESPYERAAEPGRKPSSERPQAVQADQGATGDLDLAYLLRVTGPLILPGMMMNSDSPKLVCRDCRSESSSRDMFCVTCGGLLESAEASWLDCESAAVTPACNNCDYAIEEGEIFCPSCGSAT